MQAPRHAACKLCDWQSEEEFQTPFEMMNAVKVHLIESHSDLYDENGHKRKQEAQAEEAEEVGQEEGDASGQTPAKKRLQIKGQFRFQTFEIDHSVYYLHQLVMAAAKAKGVNYEPSLGEFLRENVFRYFWEHPEVIDLRAILGPEDLQALTGIGGTQ